MLKSGGCHILKPTFFFPITWEFLCKPQADMIQAIKSFVSFSLPKSANTLLHCSSTLPPLPCLVNTMVFLSQNLFSLSTYLKLSILFPTPSGPCCQLVISIVNGSAKGLCRRVWLIRSHFLPKITSSS